MDSSLNDMIAALKARGWTSNDLRRNHLEHAAPESVGAEPSDSERMFIRYWRSVGRISVLLRDAGIFHVIIKTRRSYRYADTNVDVFVKTADVPRVKAILSGDSWMIPSRAVILKQRMIEREKLKLPPRDPALVPAHLYMAVSWRYQREVSFLDEEMIEEIPLVEEAPELEDEFGSLRVPIPARTADILLHCAEIVFENYRLTLGEALYLAWLIEHVPSQEQTRIHRLAAQRGAAEAVRCILAKVGRHLPSDPHEVEGTWPINLTVAELWSSWGERLRTQVKRGRVGSGLEEWLGYAAFGSMYRVKRTLFE